MWPAELNVPSACALIWFSPETHVVCPGWPLQNATTTATTPFKSPPISGVIGARGLSHGSALQLLSGDVQHLALLPGLHGRS